MLMSSSSLSRLTDSTLDRVPDTDPPDPAPAVVTGLVSAGLKLKLTVLESYGMTESSLSEETR